MSRNFVAKAKGKSKSVNHRYSQIINVTPFEPEALQSNQTKTESSGNGGDPLCRAKAGKVQSYSATWARGPQFRDDQVQHFKAVPVKVGEAHMTANPVVLS